MNALEPATKKFKTTIAIIGSGFAGLNAAKYLAKHKEIEVVLVDKKNHHLFQPLLYQVATAGLNPSDIASPIRTQFSKAENVFVHWGTVREVDLAEKRLKMDAVEPGTISPLNISYDYLIVACGAQHSYFGHPEWEGFAPGLKTLEQATEMRRRFLSAFERAENEIDPEKQRELLTFVVVGGGPTGVELAGAMAEISRTVLIADFRRIDPKKAKIILIEAGPRVLSAFSEEMSRQTERDLRDLGVEVRVLSKVEEISAEGVTVATKLIPSSCVFWAAGVEAAQMNFLPSQIRDRAGRVKVNEYLTLPNQPCVFVVGDMAAVDLGNGKFVPGLAPAAIQQGRYAAQAILDSLEGKRRQRFDYADKGIMATIGKRRAVVEAGAFKITGSLAWIVWLVIHIFYLIGFRNRVSVVLQWAWSYLFSKRGARLITGQNWKRD